MKSIPTFTYFDSISEFKFLTTGLLGKGSFGEVKLAVHCATNKIYAIKIVT
jgi:serine/threonine protein kinase